jgi:hypothetical protein
MAVMSLQRALDKINLLDKKIEQATYALQERALIDVVIGDKPVTGYKNNEDFKVKAEANLQSIETNIKRRDEIKTAIINKNATTEIKIGEEVMTIAAAIERRNSIMNRRNLLMQLRQQYRKSMARYEQESEHFRNKLDEHLNTLYGKENKTKHDNEDALKPFKDLNEPRLVDPLDLSAKIEELQDYIETFDSEVKFALSEANVKTDIEISE